jgi:hypothetical protein
MRKNFAPVLVLSAPVLFLFAIILLITPATAQKIKQLPPPPPGPRYKPKPTPTPEYEVVRISSNLVVVPVSVTDAQGQPVLGLKPGEFHIEEDGHAGRDHAARRSRAGTGHRLLLDVSASVDARFGLSESGSGFLKTDYEGWRPGDGLCHRPDTSLYSAAGSAGGSPKTLTVTRAKASQLSLILFSPPSIWIKLHRTDDAAWLSLSLAAYRQNKQCLYGSKQEGNLQLSSMDAQLHHSAGTDDIA